MEALLTAARTRLKVRRQLLDALDPEAILRRGYAIVRKDGKPLRSTRGLAAGAIVDVRLADGHFNAAITKVKPKKT
jgi:exodeoxyribonuclease VII large subunit